MSKWICRERCFWRDISWEPGQELAVGDYEGRKWELGRGWWAPEGMDVVDTKANLVIPWYFEPVDFSILVDPQQVILARDHRLNARNWKFMHELEVKDRSLHEMPVPVPLTPESIKELVQDPDALKSDEVKRERLKKKPLAERKA